MTETVNDARGIGWLTLSPGLASIASDTSVKISIKRAYEDAEPTDGYRVLVDRIWPRGRSRQILALSDWLKDIAPSAKLRQWFGHEPARWQVFQDRYRQELASPEQQARLHSLLDAAGKGPLTLVYGAADKEHNQAVVLRQVLLTISQRP
jgi:uncharacterized protein YeaO (DUF488 family)